MNTSLADALIAARLLARDPAGLGGILLRGDGPARAAVLAELTALIPVRRLPPGTDEEGLLGGRDLVATLAGTGATVRRGLLAAADGGLLIVPMAERMSDTIAAHVAAAMDTGEVVIERDGMTARHRTRFGLVLLDDSLDDEAAPPRLIERLAFAFDLGATRPEAVAAGDGRDDTAAAIDTERALAAAGIAFGIASVRGPLLAFRAAQGLAGLKSSDHPSQRDVADAARLVLAWRATCRPAAGQAPDGDGDHADDADNQAGDEDPAEQSQPQSSPSLDDIVLDAVTASLPGDLLTQLSAGVGRRSSSGSGTGERRKSLMRGRPLGARPGLPRGGARLSLIATLRAAAPWQVLRGRDGRIVVTRDDLRIKRFQTQTEATTIFAVDASGSAAVSRLAEAKGAVELLLAEAYVKRTEVALVAFRGESADVLLPPTRSLTRARRALAELPGGGGTPLAAGLESARQLADGVRAKGRTPFVVLLSDGRGNVALDGSTVAATAQGDADGAARRLGASGTRSIFIDISVRQRPEAALLAAAMGGRYLPLPRADARRVHDAVVAEQRR